MLPLNVRNDGAKKSTPQKSWTWKRILLSVTIFATSTTIIVGVVASFWGDSPKERIGFLIFMTIIFAVVLLSRRFPAIDRAIPVFFETFLRFFVYVLVSTAPYLIFGWLSRVVILKMHLWFQAIVLLAWGLILGGALILIFTKSGRKRMFEKLREIGSFAPVVYSLNVLMIAVMYFSTVTYIFVNNGRLSLIVPPEREHWLADPMFLYGALQDFFVWHFLDDIPLLQVNQTLRWKEPLTYSSPAVGIILLMFKITVIVPVTAAFVAYWKRDEEASAKE